MNASWCTVNLPRTAPVYHTPRVAETLRMCHAHRAHHATQHRGTYTNERLLHNASYAVREPTALGYGAHLNSVKLSTLNQLTLSCKRHTQGQRAGYAVTHRLTEQ